MTLRVSSWRASASSSSMPSALREIGIEFAGRHRGFADITLLRRLAEAARHRRARPMRTGKIGAAVERIVGRRLELTPLRSPSPCGEAPSVGRFPRGRVCGGTALMSSRIVLDAGLRADAGAALADRRD